MNHGICEGLAQNLFRAAAFRWSGPSRVVHKTPHVAPVSGRSFNLKFQLAYVYVVSVMLIMMQEMALQFSGTNHHKFAHAQVTEVRGVNQIDLQAKLEPV